MRAHSRHRATSVPAAVATITLLALATAASISYAAEPPPPATRPTTAPDRNAARNKLVADLTSGDEALVAAALKQVRANAVRIWNRRANQLDVLMDAKRYVDAEAMAMDLIRTDPTSGTVGPLQKLRARALIEQARWPEALSAARSYYDTAALKDTPDAISLVTLCLINGRPEDPAAAARFKRQQVAWASTTQPAAGGDLGEPVLATIPIDPKPFAEPLAAVKPTGYAALEKKGNLLLLSGRAAEARLVFEQAQAVAQKDREMAQAVEDVARAIRAEHGAVGPANAYLADIQGGGQ